MDSLKGILVSTGLVETGFWAADGALSGIAGGQGRRAAGPLYLKPGLGDECVWAELSDEPLEFQYLERESLLLDPLLSPG